MYMLFVCMIVMLCCYKNMLENRWPGLTYNVNKEILIIQRPLLDIGQHLPLKVFFTYCVFVQSVLCLNHTHFSFIRVRPLCVFFHLYSHLYSFF